jgi:ABC-type bacteriocin/lantibiotic exporter with double-glycine peptidase domain
MKLMRDVEDLPELKSQYVDDETIKAIAKAKIRTDKISAITTPILILMIAIGVYSWSWWVVPVGLFLWLLWGYAYQNRIERKIEEKYRVSKEKQDLVLKEIDHQRFLQ